MTVVLGFRPHTYWTAIVALGGTLDAPQVLARHKIVFAGGDERGVYHQAAEAAEGTAEALLEKVRAATEANAAAGIAAFLKLLGGDDLRPGIAVVPTGGRRLPALAEIVRVHTLQHAAEGEFYRDVVAAACAQLGLEVRRPVERELIPLACDRLGVGKPELEAQLKAMGAALGPPWSEDQRLAMLAAGLALP